MTKNVKVAAVQFEAVQGDKAANLQKLEAFVEQAARESVEIAVFPECCLTGYWFLRNLTRAQLQALAEPAGGPCAERLAGLSRKHGMSIGAGFIERTEDDRLYNSYLLAMPDGRMACHRKIHAFESDFISTGSSYTVVDTPHDVRAGILICYDLNVIENARITTLMGAEVLIAPHQTGGCRTRNPHLMGLIERDVWDRRKSQPEAIEQEILGEKGRGWLMRWLPSRAHDNGVFLIFSNGVGVDDDEVRTGNSMVLDPYGRILAESRKADDDMVIAVLDPSLLEHSTGRGWIQARRPDLYRPLTVPTGLEKETRSLKFAE